MRGRREGMDYQKFVEAQVAYIREMMGGDLTPKPPATIEYI
jgi:hypothetical protein